jgi:hypothetical protein
MKITVFWDVVACTLVDSRTELSVTSVALSRSTRCYIPENRTLQHSIHKSPLLVTIRSQINPVQISLPPSYLFKYIFLLYNVDLLPSNDSVNNVRW